MALKTKNQELTTREKEILALYHKLFERNQAPPTLRAIGAILAVYPNTVRHALISLEEKGFLRKERKVVARTRLAVSPKGKRAIGGEEP